MGCPPTPEPRLPPCMVRLAMSVSLLKVVTSFALWWWFWLRGGGGDGDGGMMFVPVLAAVVLS